MGADNKVSINANNLHLLKWTLEAYNKASLKDNALHLL